MIACLPLSVGLTAIIDDAMRRSSSPFDAQRSSEWAGFTLAGLILAGGCVAGIVAKRAMKSQTPPRFVGGAAKVGIGLNLIALAFELFIVLVLGGKW